MEGSINGKCSKMGSITIKFEGGNKKTLYAYGIWTWKLQFEKWKCKLPKDWDYGLSFNLSHFRNFVKNWLIMTHSQLLEGPKCESKHKITKE